MAYHFGAIYDEFVAMGEFLNTRDGRMSLEDGDFLGRKIGSVFRNVFKDLDDFEFPLVTWKW